MNTQFNPPINPDDPKWTAYVLGELDESERREIEQLLETSEEARALVDELTLATMSLKEELTPLGAFVMTPEQKAAVHAAAQPAPSRWFGVIPATSFPKWGWGLAAAAAAVLAVTSFVMTREISPLPATDVSGGPSVAVNKPENDAAAPRPEYAEEKRQEDQKLAVQSVTQAQPADRFRQEQAAANSAFSAAAAAPPPPPPAPGPPPAAAQSRSITLPPAGVVGGQIDNPSLAGASPTAIKKDEAASVGQTLPAPKVQDLPNGGGNILDFIELMKSTTPNAASDTTFAGVSASNIQTVRDGLSVNDGRTQAPAAFSAAPAGGGGRGAGRGGAGGGGRPTVPPAPVLAATPPPPPPPAAPLASSLLPRANDVYIPRPNTEAYDRIVDNPFVRTSQLNLATFSIDVDTASYANVRRFLTQNQIPPRDAVRIEEMLNYFNYDYGRPNGNDPIAPNLEVATTPWNPNSRLVRIGIKARDINANRRPPSNLVFLIDVSGSMNSPERLPLVKTGLKMMVERLNENDMVSMVVYAGASGLVLPPTSAASKDRIIQAIDRLEAGGSTNGASGIQLAYNQATANFIRNGTNRVILMTDGDFNVGITNQGDLTRLIEQRAKSGVFLSVLGFGMGNTKDSTLEKLADQGNGHYAYIDSINEARKVLVEEMGATLVTVAKDVKIQVDFNPVRVEAYRLIGYENRVLRTEDFNNDAKDAGDMGAGHTVTALFEVIPKGGTVPGPSIEPSKYVDPPVGPARIDGPLTREMLTLRVRYKQPNSDTSIPLNFPLVDGGNSFGKASTDFRFAASVAEFGMILRESPYRGNATLDGVLDMAQGSRGSDRNGYRQEFISLVERAKRLGR